MKSTSHIWTNKELNGDINYNQNIDEISRANKWDSLLTSPQWILFNPAEEVVQFYNNYLDSPSRQVRNRINLTGKKVHDIGFGGGRHIYFFSEMGFDVTGSDLSETAITITQAELAKRSLTARLELCAMTRLPFKDGEFDITISRSTINHATLQDIKKTIFEIARTTKLGGLFFVTFISERSSEWKKGKEVVEDLSYIPNSGPEEGLIHTFLSATDVVALLEPFFRIEEMYLSEHPPLILNLSDANSKDTYFGSQHVVIGVRK